MIDTKMDNIFLKEALTGLKNNIINLDKEQVHDLCNILVALCHTYSPETFQRKY